MWYTSYCSHRFVGSDLFDDRQGLLRVVQVEAGDVSRIDRLDQQPYSGLPEPGSGESQIGHERLSQVARFRPLGRYARQAVDFAAPQGLRVLQREPDPVLELPHAGRGGGDAALSRSPVPRRKVVQSHNQPVALQALRNSALVIVVGQRKLHRPEPRTGGGLEPVEELHLVEHHGQVGRELRHCRPLFDELGCPLPA